MILRYAIALFSSLYSLEFSRPQHFTGRTCLHSVCCPPLQVLQSDDDLDDPATSLSLSDHQAIYASVSALIPSLVPSLHSQLFFTCLVIKARSHVVKKVGFNPLSYSPPPLSFPSSHQIRRLSTVRPGYGGIQAIYNVVNEVTRQSPAPPQSLSASSRAQDGKPSLPHCMAVLFTSFL